MFISELSEKIKEDEIRSKKFQWPRSTGTGNFYRRRVLPATSDVPSEINTNIYPVILLQSVDDALPGTIRTLSESKECQGKKTLITSDESNTLKRQKISNAHVNDGNSDEISDAKLLDSYLKYL